MIEADPTHS